MDATGHPEIFFPLLGMTVVWLILFTIVVRHLRLRQPAEFERLGRPSFQQGSYRVLCWLFLRGHRKLRDKKLSALCDFMLLWFTSIQVLFFYLVWTIKTSTVVV